MSREPLTWHTGGDSGPHKPVHERTTDSQFGTSHGRRHPTLPRANLSREEPDAGNPHVRVCEGWGRQRPHLLGLRQEKSWKGEWKRNLKPFEAIQRVRPPPGRGAARQPEASLAWAAATALVKRRQRMLKPCVSLDIMYPLRPSVGLAGGGVDKAAKGEVLPARPGSWSRAKAWDGSPGNLRDPVRVHGRNRPDQGTPADQLFQA